MSVLALEQIFALSLQFSTISPYKPIPGTCVCVRSCMCTHVCIHRWVGACMQTYIHSVLTSICLHMVCVCVLHYLYIFTDALLCRCARLTLNFEEI